MKKLFAVLLSLCLLFSLWGCSFLSDSIQNPVKFYYQRTEYLYGQEDAVIAAEERDGTGHIRDMAYLLRLYLMGPHDEELISPFPRGLLITDIRQGTGAVILTLTDSLSELSPSGQTLACACLALTCMDMFGQDSVTLIWGEEIRTLDRSSLTVFDAGSQSQ